MREAFIRAVSVLAFAACADQHEPAAVTPIDGRPEIPPELVREVEALDPRVDTDGDGLQDIDELIGWTIRVDETGRPQGVVTREVASDPDLPDTDDDGLLDGVERMAGADPNSTDTDGDGLDDHAEVQRWGTSPASVDSDLDARGKEPDPSAAPDVTLYDAAELKLMADPNDPLDAGGDLVPAPDATNPLQGDTDGDGVWDYDENATPTRSSSIADTPELRVRIAPTSTLGLYLNLTVTEGETRSEEKGLEIGVGGNVSTSVTNTTTMKVASWLKNLTEVGVILNIQANTEQAGADVGVAYRQETGVGVKASVATTFATDGTIAAQTSQVVNEVETLGKSRKQTIDGGRIVMKVAIENVGRVPCRLGNLAVELGMFQPGLLRGLGGSLPVARLEPVADDELVLAIGERVDVLLEARDVQADRMLMLMREPHLISLAPASYDVFAAGDEDYEFIEGEVADRTATLVIEYGPDAIETLRVAAQVYHDAAGRNLGITVADALTLAGIPWDAEPLTPDVAPELQEYVFAIGDRTTELYPDAASDLGDPLPYPEGKAPGPRLVKKGWYALIQRGDGSMAFDATLFRARVRPGDRASLFFLQDGDRDGLPLAEETLRGSSDALVDSDGDGLSDYWETAVGWDVAIEGYPTYHVFSDPARPDADGDGLSDKDELAGSGTGSDPFEADTDHDLVDDRKERDDTSRSPLVFEDREAPKVYCFDMPGQPPTFVVRAEDATLNLSEVKVTWADDLVTAVPMAPTAQWEARLVRSVAVKRVEAKDDRGNTKTITTCGPPVHVD